MESLRVTIVTIVVFAAGIAAADEGDAVALKQAQEIFRLLPATWARHFRQRHALISVECFSSIRASRSTPTELRDPSSAGVARPDGLPTSIRASRSTTI
jgi:hypothetical protein